MKLCGENMIKTTAVLLEDGSAKSKLSRMAESYQGEGFDYIFYLFMRVAVNQKHLRERLIDSECISADADCSLAEIKKCR